MKNESLLYGIIGLLAGSLLTVLVASNAVNNNMTGMMRMMGMKTSSENMMKEEAEEQQGMGMGSSMEDMMESMEEKEGDEFDKAFINAMIVHHEGAIKMAEEAKTNALHDEIKNLADDIILAQTSEIEMMKAWQKDWGYAR